MSEDLIGSLLLEVTSKSNWYSKIFDDDRISVWRKEFLEANSGEEDIFNYCVKLLRATAQGSKHDENCKWKDNISLCDECKEDLKKEVIEHPDNFGIDEDDDPIVFDENDYWIDELLIEPCNHPKCDCVSPDCELYDYVQYQPIISNDLHEKLKK